eukprot:1020502-Rhodomonas_salina.3
MGRCVCLGPKKVEDRPHRGDYFAENGQILRNVGVYYCLDTNNMKTYSQHSSNSLNCGQQWLFV